MTGLRPKKDGLAVSHIMHTLLNRLVFLAVLSPIFAASVPASALAEPIAQPDAEQVVLLHGIARSASHMQELAEFLTEAGYIVHNLDYPSTDHNLETLASMVAEDIQAQLSCTGPVHIVGYSMGGLVSRAIVTHYRPDNLGRVVQLAPPNGGSEIADLLQNNWLYQKIYGPAGQQLVTAGAGLEDLLGAVDYELGVIAGTASIDPFSSFIIPGADDGKVAVVNTKVTGMQDHLTVSASHTFFPQNHEVQAQTLFFLRHGVFAQP